MKYTQEQLNLMEAVDIYKLIISGKISRFPTGFWQRPDALDNARKVTRYLIEEKLGWSEDDLKDKLVFNIFIDNKLSGMYTSAFHNCVIDVIENAYPGKFHPWELNIKPNNYWNLKTAKKATKWLIEEKLHWSEEDVKCNISVNTFKDNKLNGLLCHALFCNSVFKVIDNAYPNKFKPWELSSTPKNYWTKETAKEAVLCLMNNLSIKECDIPSVFSCKFFQDNGVYGMLKEFDNSIFKLVDFVFPKKFDKDLFRPGVSRNERHNPSVL